MRLPFRNRWRTLVPRSPVRTSVAASRSRPEAQVTRKVVLGRISDAMEEPSGWSGKSRAHGA